MIDGNCELSFYSDCLTIIVSDEVRGDSFLVNYAAVWENIISDSISYVVFENGTCVIFSETIDGDLADNATSLLESYGLVGPGSSFGDFGVHDLAPPINGWMVTSHHPQIVNYVSADDVEQDTDTSEPQQTMVIGLLGRQRRGEDAAKPTVIHVEDRRKPGTDENA